LKDRTRCLCWTRIKGRESCHFGKEGWKESWQVGKTSRPTKSLGSFGSTAFTFSSFTLSSSPHSFSAFATFSTSVMTFITFVRVKGSDSHSHSTLHSSLLLISSFPRAASCELTCSRSISMQKTSISLLQTFFEMVA